MALSENKKQQIKEEEEYRLQVAAAATPAVKPTYGFAALLSFFIPGLGQIVKGQVGKGILAFLAFCLGLIMLVFPGVIIWIWQIVDAYNDPIK